MRGRSFQSGQSEHLAHTGESGSLRVENRVVITVTEAEKRKGRGGKM